MNRFSQAAGNRLAILGGFAFLPYVINWGHQAFAWLV